MLSCDIIFATIWQTAYYVNKFMDCKQKFYFIQDYEPYFYPMGTEYISAERTYKMGFKCITAGKWLTSIMRDKYKLDSDFFELAPDKRYYQIDNDCVRKNNQICLYVRFSTPRRGSELGILALKLASEQLRDLKIILYGDTLSSKYVPFSWEHKGVLNHVELAKLYNESTLGISISLINYSLVPQEMISCDLPIIEINTDYNQMVFNEHKNFFSDTYS